MDSIPLKLTTQVRKCLVFLTLFGASFLHAQTNPSLSFQVNFEAADVNAYGITFRQDNVEDGIFDLVVVQRGEEIFRFRNFDSKKETLYSFALINDKKKAFENLKTQNTLTKKADVEADLLLAYEDKSLAFIGLLESKTPTGASTRMQIAKMVSEDDAGTILSDAKQD
jgi:hypothetical protein